MKKYRQVRIKYILLTVLVAVFVLGSAFMCNLCSYGGHEGLAGKNDDSGVPATTQKDNPEDDEDGEDKSKKSAPQITLEIYEGPLYSAADDVCYYRIQAKVKGEPAPEIKWSRDDSRGAFGMLKAQVNLTRENPNYTLKATATNSEGTDEKTINLAWNCADEENDPPEDSLPAIRISEIPVYTDRSGYYLDCPDAAIGSIFQEGDNVYVGDAPAAWGCPVPSPVTGFFTYKLSNPPFAGKEITEATIEFSIKQRWGDTSYYNSLLIMVFDGSNWITVQSIPENRMGNFTVNSPDFLEFVKNNVSPDFFSLELQFRFDPYITNNDELGDGWEYDLSGAVFKIKYLD